MASSAARVLTVVVVSCISQSKSIVILVASAVTDQQMNKLGYAFVSTSITSFDELCYFTGITKLPSGGFSGCRKLVSVKLPSSVTTIESINYKRCTAITEYHFLSTEPPVLGTDALTVRNACTVYVPAGSKEKYAAEATWASFVNNLVEEE